MMSLSKTNPEKNQLGLYWGKDGLTFVATSDKKVTKAVSLPWDTPLADENQEPVPEELKVTALIKSAIQQSSFTIPDVNVTLAIKDFSFRTFVIPWMSPQEAKGVISFEATKYIPIPLEELFFTYHVLPFTENNQKNLRVFFFAARKDLLSRTCGLIEQAGLKVAHIEPEPISLARILLQQKRIAFKQAVAVVLVTSGEGRLFIIDNGLVQFVREFQMPEEKDDPMLIRVKLFNEVRVSLNFYARQNAQGKIDNILAITTMPLPQLEHDLSQELSKPASGLTFSGVFPSVTEGQEIGSLAAWGNAILDDALKIQNFELAEKALARKAAGDEAQKQFRRYLTSAGVVAGCLIVGLLGVLLPRQIQRREISRIAALKAETSRFEMMSSEEIQAMQTTLGEKLNTYKNIQLTSETTFYLHKIPNLLPDQAWLKRVAINYRDQALSRKGKAPTLSLNGFVYLPETNNQYRYVMAMVDAFKKDPELSARLGDISLDNMNQETLNNIFVTTAFRMTLK